MRRLVISALAVFLVSACSSTRTEAEAERDLAAALRAYEAVISDALGESAITSWVRGDPTIGCDLRGDLSADARMALDGAYDVGDAFSRLTAAFERAGGSVDRRGPLNDAEFLYLYLPESASPKGYGDLVWEDGGLTVRVDVGCYDPGGPFPT